MYRIESGSELTIPLVVPNENEKTFVIFTNDYQNADQIRQGLGFAFFLESSFLYIWQLRVSPSVFKDIISDVRLSHIINYHEK